MNIRELYQNLLETFTEAGITSPQVNCHLILTKVLGFNRMDLHLNFNLPVTQNQKIEILSLKNQRLDGNPIQYILGETEFYGNHILVSPAVLIPRPETEYLVQLIVDQSNENERILDIGTGSGCIPIALAKNLKKATIEAVDISQDAIEIAKKNGLENNVSIKFYQSDLFSKVTGTFDIIVSNPPYIPADEYEELESEIKLHEPMNALVADEEGLYFYRKILEKVSSFLAENGTIFFEIGYSQSKKIEEIARKNGFKEITVIKDLNNFDRYIIIK